MTPSWRWRPPRPWSTPTPAPAPGEDTLRTTDDLVPSSTRTAGPASAPATRPSWTPYAPCGPGCARCGTWRRTTSSARSTRSCSRPRRSPSSSTTTTWAGTSTPCPQEAPLATRMAGRGRDGVHRRGPHRRARPAQDLCRRRLRGRRRRPVPQPVEAVLRGRLRQPRERPRLPRPAARTRADSAAARRGRLAPVAHDVAGELQPGGDRQHHRHGQCHGREPPEHVAGHLEAAR